MRAQDVAVVARPRERVTLFADVGPVALMLADVAATRDRSSRSWGPGRERREPRPAARDPAGLPRRRQQLDRHRRAAEHAQEHRPVPRTQGRGGPRPAPPRAGVRRRTRVARLPLAGRTDPAAGLTGAPRCGQAPTVWAAVSASSRASTASRTAYSASSTAE